MSFDNTDVSKFIKEFESKIEPITEITFVHPDFGRDISFRRVIAENYNNWIGYFRTFFYDFILSKNFEEIDSVSGKK